MGRDITESNKAEQKLKESEEKYRDLLNNIHEAIVELDENGNVEYMSPQVFKLTGYLPEEQIGINLRELIHPDDLELVLITFNKLMQSGEIQSMDFRRKHKDGHYIYVNSSGRRVKIGDKYKIIGITKDITDRQRAEEKFQVLFKNSTSGIAYHKLIYDSEGKPIDYIITEVNPQFEAILPFKREDVINKRATEAYGVDIAPYLEIFSKVAELFL